MAGVGAQISCSTNCWKKHPFNGGKRNVCRATRDCACDVCGPLFGLNNNLWNGCVHACNAKDNRPKTTNEYLHRVGVDAVFNNTGVLLSGYDFEDTNQGKFQARLDAQKKVTTFIEIALAGVLGVVFLALVFTRLIKF